MAEASLYFGQVQSLVFWSGQEPEERVNDDDPAELEPVSDLLDNLQEAIDFRESQDGKPESMYVTLLHGEYQWSSGRYASVSHNQHFLVDMLDEATKEHHLFSGGEFKLFMEYALLSCE